MTTPGQRSRHRPQAGVIYGAAGESWAQRAARVNDALALRHAARVLQARARRPDSFVLRVLVRCLVRAAERLERGPDHD